MDLKLKIDPVIHITALLILLFILCLSVQEAGAIRQVRPHVITPQPGPPPQAVHNPSFYKWTSREIINAFKESGLEAVNPQKGFTTSSSTGETTIFLIPSSGENIGGFVSSYRSSKALEEDRKYFSAMNKPLARPAWRIFRRENILLLISGKVPEGKAIRYKETLNRM